MLKCSSDDNESDIDEDPEEKKTFIPGIEVPNCYETDSENIFDVFSTTDDESDFDEGLDGKEKK